MGEGRRWGKIDIILRDVLKRMTRPESVLTWVVVAVFVAAGAVLYLIAGDELLRDHLEGASSTISVAGSTTVLPLAVACAAEFHKGQRDAVVTVAGGGTDAGIEELAAGKIDIAMASRKVGEGEMEGLGASFEEHPIALDGVAIVVSRPIFEAGVDELSRHQVSAIYSGDVASWKELGGPDLEIVAVSRSHGSGTGEIFSERVATPGVSIYLDSGADVERYVARSDRAIGYIGLNLAFDEELGVIAYEGVVPSAASVRDGSYPLARTLYMYTLGEADPEEVAFLEFVTGEGGRSIAEDLGFVPISA